MRPGDPTDDIRERITGEKVQRTSFFASARQRAAAYLGEPRKLRSLVDRAAHMLGRRLEPLSERREALAASLRLLRAWSGGRYRDIPTASLVSIVAALIYFVTPVDLVPDFILSIGLVDDAALLGWVLSSVRRDIDRFTAWERKQAVSAPQDRPAGINPLA
jgi:uncharacterized membrane protein YkvA (DUF1232 family)